MRTFYEINADIEEAVRVHNTKALPSLAAEMRALDTPDATATALNTLGNEASLTGHYTEAIEYYHQSLAIHNELGNKSAVARVTRNIARVHDSTCDYPSALEHSRRALFLFEELGDVAMVALTNLSIGSAYMGISDYPSTLAYQRRALALYTDIDDRLGIAQTTANIGNLLHRIGDYASSLEHHHRARDLYQEIGLRAGVGLVNGNIGGWYAANNNYALALEHYKRALEVHESIGARKDIEIVTGNMISALIAVGNHDEAFLLHQQQAQRQINNPGILASHIFNGALLAEHRGDLDSAKHHLEDALNVALEADLRERALSYHLRLRDLAQKRNDFAGYIEHNNEYNRINEEIRGKEATQKLTMMEAQRTMDAAMRERDKERALLYGALPKSVADRMIRGEDVSGDHFDNAAVMFIDIVGFTSHTSHMPPSNVVKLLENIFRTLDALCDEHNVVKVKTVGDSYMCFRGDADASTNALSVARVALAVLQHPGTWPTGEPLHVRIGIHIGPATAGVIGTQRLQYDLWGDTVNVASRMESTSEPGRIHISEALAKALNKALENALNEAHIVPRGTMDIKGKGMMKTYWLESPLS